MINKTRPKFVQLSGSIFSTQCKREARANHNEETKTAHKVSVSDQNFDSLKVMRGDLSVVWCLGEKFFQLKNLNLSLKIEN